MNEDLPDGIILPDSEPPIEEGDTLIVPPPAFRDRLLAAKRARAAHAQSSTEFTPAESAPESSHSDDDLDSSALNDSITR